MNDEFHGRHYRGRGDGAVLRLLEVARRMFEPDPQYANLSMLYTPAWNGLVEGPKWNAWWIQNSYGTTYSALPFLQEPYLTFLQNAQDLWFDQMGDGRRTGGPRGEVAPDGSLCDAARPGWVFYKQGDGRTELHDWGLEFTAAGVLMQAELLLISRDPAAAARYLPRLERCIAFLDTRCDPGSHLFLAGPAANLLAPSYAGMRRDDGRYDPGHLAGLSITYLAALDRMIELETLVGAEGRSAAYRRRRDLVRRSLPLLLTDAGYFVKAVDPVTGEKHGVFGARRFGYFEAVPNHDAVAFRVVDDASARRIYASIAAIPGLRPHDLIITNHPSLDDMYQTDGLFEFGRWVNGGHWSTCEARAVLAYYRVGAFDDIWRSLRQLLRFADAFRMDNPLTDFGNEVYFPKDLVHLCYDTLGPFAAAIRGLFEYVYTADGLTLFPHVPPQVRELHQLDPIRFGPKRLYLSVVGTGPVAQVWVNGARWESFDAASIFLPFERTPDHAQVVICLGETASAQSCPNEVPTPSIRRAADSVDPAELDLVPEAFGTRARRLHEVWTRLAARGLGDSYEAAHARLALSAMATVGRRGGLFEKHVLKPLAPEVQRAADAMYVGAAETLAAGIEDVLADCRRGDTPHARAVTTALDDGPAVGTAAPGPSR